MWDLLGSPRRRQKGPEIESLAKRFVLVFGSTTMFKEEEISTR